ncbi:exodeoxyribonuclease V subunit alpha [Taibaiella lutea]|uniref:RecBCD enzyme subunit RecD n=1 Tax=Taibaiella lutea TaxID=2608001 RepID=A0A5M6CSA8_9BACT|nr:exodeoxyribonuclease V subunit alpha [Taibaiella lutea]KAA5536842.1 exodeoxyribonuclease V subunit alpha [Taibaiella lutea]
MATLNDVHQQFAEYFKEPALKPYLYLLSQKMSEGHICIDETDLNAGILPESYPDKNLSLEKIAQHPLVTTKTEYKPFVLNGERFYMQRYFVYETQVLSKIKELAASSAMQYEQRMQQLLGLKQLVQQLFTDNKTAQTDWQLVAVLVALLQDFTIITGGPGTGKTTTVAKILTLMFTMHPSLKVAMVAPTGKAAARMSESLMKTQATASDDIKSNFARLKSSTIHRLLGWQQGTPYFRHNAENHLPYDLIIVDESSMIDVALFAKLLQAIGKGTRVILLGDKDQLASVEAGSLFGDLCNAVNPLNHFSESWRSFINQFITDDDRKIPKERMGGNIEHPLFRHIIELQHSYRFDGNKGIGKIARAVIQNDEKILERFLEERKDEQVLIDQLYKEQVFLKFIEGYKAIITEKSLFDEDGIIAALNNLGNLRILCALNEGDQGVYQMNARVEAYLAREKGIQPNDIFYEHRPIMITKNNYTLGLYNGDVGILRKDKNNVMKAWFLQSGENGTVSLKSVLPGFIMHMETVYAMTIHKSQGSEFNNVLVVLPKQQSGHILTRELVYTAITRAKEKVVIQADKEVLLAAAKAQVKRGSGIIERLQE